MSIRVKCPGCQRGINAPEKLAGRSANCPACGTTLIVPTLQEQQWQRTPDVPPPAPTHPPEIARRAVEPSLPPVTVKIHKPRGSFGAGFQGALGCMAAVSVVLIGGCIGLVWLASSTVSRTTRPRPAAPAAPLASPAAPLPIPVEPQSDPAPTETFEIVDVDMRITETNEIWSKFAWIFKVKNTGPSPVSFSAEVEFLDADGFVVDTDHAFRLVAPPGVTSEHRGAKMITADSVDSVDSVSVKAQEF